MTLKDLKTGERGIITAIGGDGALRQHFLDMGLIPGGTAEVVQFAPLGDPVEIRIHDYELTLRLDDAARIEVERAEEAYETDSGEAGRADAPEKSGRRKKIPHPAIGEPGIHHVRGSGEPLPEGTKLTFALVGNQNCGKTTLFNRLTGANQHVGNFPGVTVDRKDGALIGYPNTLITDLPGIYSMSPYTGEELVSRNFLLEEKPRGIINIIDATNLERNLYLTMQLTGMGCPMVVAVNMMDELTGNGGSIDINRMEALLGVPVVPISAAKNEGIEELLIHALHVAQYGEKPLIRDFCSRDEHGGAVHRCLHAVRHLVEDHAKKAELPLHFAAEKTVEGDTNILERLALDTNELEMLEHITLQMEAERGLDRSAAIADMRYTFINMLCRVAVRKPRESREHVRSREIDRILTGKYTAIPVFALLMTLVFVLTFNVIGAFFQEILEHAISHATLWCDEKMYAAGVNTVIHSLLIEGIFGGVGSVLSFLPIVVVMFFFLSLLEDSGYIARVAFFMDKLLRKMGLSGRSMVPLLIGFGCTVPAIMSTRTLPSERDRKMTILLTPFMSCTAKLPIYAFFANAFFPGRAGLIITALYITGIITGVFIAFLYKGVIFRGEAVPFVMELPNYRLPSLQSTLQLMWEKAKDFLQKAFSVILLASIIVWFLQSFDPRFNMAENSSMSIMAVIAGCLVPVFRPLGLGDWRICTSLITGFMAKESVVSTMKVLSGAEGGVMSILTPLSAGTLLVFSLLYTPCVAAVASVRRELGVKWAVIMVAWQCVLAWLAAGIFMLVARLFISV